MMTSFDARICGAIRDLRSRTIHATQPYPTSPNDPVPGGAPQHHGPHDPPDGPKPQPIHPEIPDEPVHEPRTPETIPDELREPGHMPVEGP